MGGYSELKREQEKNTKRLKEANSKSDNLDVETQKIKKILNNLKSPLLDKIINLFQTRILIKS